MKRKHALLANLAGLDVDPEVVSRLIAKYQEQSSDSSPSADLLAPLMGQLSWISCPEGSKCTQCQSTEIERSISSLGGPYSGTIRCRSCGHRESVTAHIARTCFTVEPMPPGAKPFYGPEE
jgi:hypothetical protein